MRADVAERTRTGDLRSQTPDHRKIFIDDPILGVAGTKMINAFANLTASNDLFRQRHCRQTSIIETNHVRDARSLSAVDHSPRLGGVSCQWFFAKYRFAGA